MTGPFIDHFRTVVEPLFGRQFTGADGIPAAELDGLLNRAGYEVPEALRDFYTVVGRSAPVLDAHNQFYAPSGFRRMDGKLVFLEENQAVVYWGYDEDQGWRTDPPIYQGVNCDPMEWHLELGRMCRLS